MSLNASPMSRIATGTTAVVLAAACLTAPRQATAQPPVQPPLQAATQLPTEARGQQLFLRCQTCHEVAAGRPNKVGPNLHGVMGRRAGTAPGFAYSTAMRGSNIRWTDANLDLWLQRPAQVVPGTSMAFVGLSRPEDRSALIAWLRTHTR